MVLIIKNKVSGNLLVSFGLGILISALLMKISSLSIGNIDIEAEARKLGMIYPDEIKAIYKE